MTPEQLAKAMIAANVAGNKPFGTGPHHGTVKPWSKYSAAGKKWLMRAAEKLLEKYDVTPKK